MIAAFGKGEALHIIRWVGRVRLHVKLLAYCDTEGDASDGGVLQVPDATFTQNRDFTISPGLKLRPCPHCRLKSGVAIS